MKKGWVFSMVGAFLFAGSVHAGQDVQCTLCWFEPHGNATASVCETKTVSEKRLPAFMYHVGEQIGQKGVKEWSFECSTKDKTLKGHFVIEEKKNEGN